VLAVDPEIDAVVGEFVPEVVSQLTMLPRWGPKWPKDFEPAKELWRRGAPNLVAAAQRSGVRPRDGPLSNATAKAELGWTPTLR
jgi:hypothetical protein